MAALALGSQLASPTEQRYRSRSGLMLADVFETEFRALVAALSEGRRDYPTVPWSSITLHAHQATASLPAAVAGGQQLERLAYAREEADMSSAATTPKGVTPPTSPSVARSKEPSPALARRAQARQPEGAVAAQ